MIIEKKKLKDEIKRIYISGPITGVENWQETFLTAEKELCEMPGIFFVINPIYIAERVEKTLKMPDYTDYMREDIKALSECDCICMLPGWKRSKGARMEYRIAKILNMNVLEYQTK